MKTKYILFAVAILFAIPVFAVEFGTYQPIYSTSSVRMSSYGGGGQTSGMSGSSFRSTSSMMSSGSVYSGGIYSNPSYAPTRKNNIFHSADDNLLTADRNLNINFQPNPSARTSGIRRMNHTAGNGTYDGEYSDDGYYWDDEEKEWFSIPIGATRGFGGDAERWDGSAWVPIGGQSDPNTPIGSVPWMLMLLLAGVYIWRHNRKQA